MVTNYDGENIEFKDTLPLLPVRDIVIYPFMIIPLFVGRESSIKAVEESIDNTDRLIMLASQKDMSAEAPSPSEIYEMGTVAMIMRMRKLPDGRIKILIQGLSKARIKDFKQTAPFYQANLEKIESKTTENADESVEAFMKSVREQLEQVINLGKVLTPDILMVLEDIQDPGRLSDLIASNLNLHVSEAQTVLEILDPVERLHKIHEILNRELEVLSMQAKIKSQNFDPNASNNKEYFLREQIKAIKNELGEGPQSSEPQDEFAEMRDKIAAANMPEHAEKETLKQLARLEKMHPDSSEASILRSYLEWMYDLPWSVSSKEDLDLHKAKEVLDEDHFEMKEVKERVLEHLAVQKIKGGQIKGPIICLSGPPGVGKTSLGKSVAKATGREFVRLSLGGVKDEAEIRGHRRTYVGSMPGRFIQAIKQAGTNNPLIMLDEIDKLGSDYKGDPSSALLEVLDPEQNGAFRDHYLNIDFDLSNVMFIATANVLDNIPGPLRDRMEVLNLSGYSQEEKLAISNKYLIPKQMDENGVTEKDIEFTNEGVNAVIKSFTSEAGLRNLERKLGALCRKVAHKIAIGSNEKKTLIKVDTVEKLLGPPIFTDENEERFDEVGVCTGLAWTAHGGEILAIESSQMKGKGVTLTGRLGDVMKESAQAAFGFIRSRALDLGIDEDVFDSTEIHIHLPSGSIPKDGPSAGITLATSVVSLLTNTPIKKEVAMTGEITLTGKVLPIGGLKEKALAAMRKGITTIIIPYQNKKDLVDIKEEYLEKLTFVPVKSFWEVLDVALCDWQDRRDLLRNDLLKRKKVNKGPTNFAA